jgi:hypothetical protein
MHHRRLVQLLLALGLLLPSLAWAVPVRTGTPLMVEIGRNNTGSTSVTVPADAQLMVCTTSGYKDSVGFFSGGSLKIGGQAMTLVPGGDATTAAWQGVMGYKVAPPTGAQALAWAWAGTGQATDRGGIMCAYYKNIATASPVRSTSCTQSPSNPHTTGTLTAQSGDLAIAFVFQFVNGGTDTTFTWTGATEVTEFARVSDFADGALAEAAPTSNLTIAASGAQNQDGGICALVLAGGGSPPPPPPPPPPGVTLQPIDGGPNYYCANGFTYACNAGWDHPSFFPVGLWLPPMLSQADADRWKDLGLNTAFLLTGNSSLSLLRSNGLWAVLQTNESGLMAQIGNETVGLLGADENHEASVQQIQVVPNSLQDHRYWWLQNTWTVIGYGEIGGVPMSTIMSQPHPTPNGTTRHFDLLSADTYWFTGSKDTGMLGPWGIIYNLGRDMTMSEGARGYHYGDMVDRLRAYQPTYPAPLPQFVENGGPGNACTDPTYITPPEMNAAVWGSIIHGARQIIYFNHTFCGSHQTQDNFANSYYQTIQPGQTISIYNQAKATNALVAQLAPVLNAPFALGYVTVSPAASTFAGFDVMAKYYNNAFYIFAMPRYATSTTNQTATFTVASGAAVTVINESRTLTITGGQFTDTFATGNTVHIYKITP